MHSSTIVSESLKPIHWQRLLEVSRILSSTLELQPLLRQVLEVATELTDTEAASILLLDNQTGELRFAAATGHANIGDNMIVPLEGSIAGWIVRNGKPLNLEDVQADDRHYQGIDMATQSVTRSLLGVPLLTREKVIGALEVINKKQGESYTEQDLTLLQSLASQAAIAIENARLFQQSDLIAEIMHELKTPMMAITASTELLMYDQVKQDQRTELVKIIQQEVRRLSRMTQDYLDLARIESGRLSLEHHEVDLTVIIQEVMHIQRPQANNRHITLHYEGETVVPFITGDADRLKQVLLNLVSNAIKYNREWGTITVRLACLNGELCLSVHDTGEGIAPEHLEHLFQRFYRVPGSETKSEGSGLGLSIAQRIVEAHGGRIVVESNVGQGSTFYCWFPLT
ncbi:MAG: GAF domain-containing sensor histidine kinase [Chloroflexi bacterium]|nr:GAF domain-containing sensor histidine kinase [Chloroflexota bacterium]